MCNPTKTKTRNGKPLFNQPNALHNRDKDNILYLEKSDTHFICLSLFGYVSLLFSLMYKASVKLIPHRKPL